MDGGLRLRGPNQQATDGTELVKGVEQPAPLVGIPDVAPLELRQGHVAAVDVVEDGGDLHSNCTKSTRGSIAIGPVGGGRQTIGCSSGLAKLLTQEGWHRGRRVRAF